MVYEFLSTALPWIGLGLFAAIICMILSTQK